MATVEFRYDPKNTAWFTANAAMVLKAGEPAYHDTTGLFKLGDGVTALSALSFLPTVSASTPTLQQVLTAGSILAGNNTATGIGDLTLGTDDIGVYTSTIKTSGSTILHTSYDGIDTGLFTQTPTNNTFTKSVTALSFIKNGGTSAQFLKADGTVDSSTYLTTLGTAATSLTTTGSSGAATLIANVLNVPNYTLAGLGGTTLAAVNAQNLSVFAATTSSQLAGVISDETGSGALVFGTSPTFTTKITTPLINGTSGTLQIGTTDLVNIGNATTTSQRLVRIGQDTAWIDIGSQSGSTARPAIYLNTTTPDTTNYALSCHQTTGNTYLNGKSGTQILVNGGIVTTYSTNQVSFAVNAAGGSTINYQFTVPNNTALTASTEVPIFKIIGGNNTWPTGAITNQRWSWITANTANFSAASTITNSYGLFVEAATAGTNATITNNYAAGFSGNVRIDSDSVGIPLIIRGLTSSPNQNQCIYFTATPSSTNYSINFGNTYNIFNQTTQFFRENNNDIANFTSSGLTFSDAKNIIFNTTTGTKIATATTQKIGFWNATPIVQPSAVTTVQGFYDAMASTGLIASGTITLPTGYGRSINNIAINTTGAAVANTDYYYFCTATLTFTLPTAVGNTNTYYIKVTSGTLTINTTSSQTIDGSLTIVTSVANTAFTLISDGTNWQII